MSNSSKVLTPKGLLDNASGTQIRREVNELLDAGIETILIDFTNITFMDSSGLGTIVSILQQVRTKGANIYLCSLNDQVKMIMDLTKMDKIFEILPDRPSFDLIVNLH